MKQGIIRILTFLFIVSLTLAGLSSCNHSFSTASDRWDINFNKDKIAFKNNFLKQEHKTVSNRKRPNILLIVADDLGKAEVSAYGLRNLKTPNIDKIAEEGVLFTDCYVTSPLCSPSRAGILTGRYPTRFGFETQLMEYYPKNKLVYSVGKNIIKTDFNVLDTDPVYPPKKEILKQGIPPSEINIAEFLKTRNYNTAWIGKWHNGSSPELIPGNRGFDYCFGFYGGFTLYTEKHDTPGVVNHIQDIFTSKYQWKIGRKGTSAIRRNDTIIDEKRYLTDAILDEAIGYMKANKNKENPFFMYLSFNAPHVPFQAPQAYYDMHSDTKDENKRVYYAMISALDDAIGKLMKQIELMGLDENTLIFFISDNGAAAYTGATDNLPYKGGKSTWFEGGLNIPFMMKWKGHIPEGEVYEKPVSSLDIFMTIAKATNLALPKDRVYDGVNLVPYVNRVDKKDPHDVLFWRADHLYAMRTKNWKFLMSKRDNWVELYNISRDKYELHDLNLERSDTLKNMLREFNQWEKQLSDPLWPRLIDVKFEIDGKTYLFPS